MNLLSEYYEKGGKESVESTVEKSELDYSKLKDLGRAGITVLGLDNIRWCLHQLSLRAKEVQVVRYKNRIDPETKSDFGYRLRCFLPFSLSFFFEQARAQKNRDILLNLRFTDENGKPLFNGHIVELQVHLASFQNIRKHGKGHANYSASRFLVDFVLLQKKFYSRKGENEEKTEGDVRRERIIDLVQTLLDS